MIRRLWGFLVFLIAAGALGACAYLYRRLEREEADRGVLAAQVAAFDPRFEQFKTAVRDVDRHLSSTVFQEIDLEAAGWQPIAGGFYVVDLGVAPAGRGSRIVGKIVNPTSVTHEDAKISLRIGLERATFTLPHVPPAAAQPFEVILPGVAPTAAHKAFVALEGSTINYASSTTRKKAGSEPVDTDKLLR